MDESIIAIFEKPVSTLVQSGLLYRLYLSLMTSSFLIQL